MRGLFLLVVCVGVAGAVDPVVDALTNPCAIPCAFLQDHVLQGEAVNALETLYCARVSNGTWGAVSNLTFVTNGTDECMWFGLDSGAPAAGFISRRAVGEGGMAEGFSLTWSSGKGPGIGDGLAASDRGFCGGGGPGHRACAANVRNVAFDDFSHATTRITCRGVAGHDVDVLV